MEVGDAMTYAPSYNVGELEDLIAAKDVNLQQDQTAFDGLSSAWQLADGTAEGLWLAQWQALNARYQTARAAAERLITADAIESLGITSAQIARDATSEYNAILTALNPAYASNTAAVGSLVDLDGRLRDAAASLNRPLPPPSPLPQPTNPASGIDPTSWQGYLTGAAYKLGLVSNPPPGTPGTGAGPGAVPLFPSWLKWTAGSVLGLWTLSKVSDIAKALK